MMKHLFFDLDGTLVDSSAGIYSSIGYALEKMGREPLEIADLRRFIGPPLLDSFLALGMSDKEAEESVAWYREHYKKAAMLQVQVYEGIEALLKNLAEQEGYQLQIATSKPEVFAKEILAELGLDHYFNGIYGADLAGVRHNKAAVLAYAMENTPQATPENSWMIGDRKHDMLGAETNGVAAIGVLWGFGSRQELEEAGASYCAADTAELQSYCESLSL